MSTITLIIASRLEEVALVGTALHAFCRYASLPERDVGMIELAVVEAVNNVIFHGYGNEPEHDITVIWTQRADHLQIDIVDCGKAIGELPSAEMPAPDLENGRGWPIIRAVMDSIRYRSEKGINTLTLVKKIGQKNR